MSNRLKELREHYDITQAELARKIHKSPGYISLIETGRQDITDEVIQDIADTVGCNIEWLRTGEGEIEGEAAYDKVGIPERLRHLRNEKGLSLTEFAARIGSTKSQVSAIERSVIKPSKEYLWTVSNTFSVSLSWLMTGTDSDQEDIDGDMYFIDQFLREHPESRHKVLEMIRKNSQ